MVIIAVPDERSNTHKKTHTTRTFIKVIKE